MVTVSPTITSTTTTKIWYDYIMCCWILLVLGYIEEPRLNIHPHPHSFFLQLTCSTRRKLGQTWKALVRGKLTYNPAKCSFLNKFYNRKQHKHVERKGKIEYYIYNCVVSLVKKRKRFHSNKRTTSYYKCKHFTFHTTQLSPKSLCIAGSCPCKKLK